MTTENVKKVLFEQTGIAASNWKRISKSKSADGTQTRLFQDSVSKKIMQTNEDKNGVISVADKITTSIPAKFNSKIIGYYQFDNEQCSVAIVTKEFWEQHGYIDSNGSESDYIPDNFYELSEGIYEHDCDNHAQACEQLEKAGFVAKKLF